MYQHLMQCSGRHVMLIERVENGFVVRSSDAVMGGVGQINVAETPGTLGGIVSQWADAHHKQQAAVDKVVADYTAGASSTLG